MKKESQIVPFLNEPMALGEIFVQSGMFKDVKTKAEAVVKILAGREIGLNPIESMNNIFIVNGKTTVMAGIIARMIKQSKKYNYKEVALTDTECTLLFLENIDGKWEEIGKSTFTFKDAAKAGLVNKEVWKNYPRNMLFSRAISNGAKWYCPDVFSGYTPEELQNIPENEMPEETTIVEFDENGEEKING